MEDALNETIYSYFCCWGICFVRSCVYVEYAVLLLLLYLVYIPYETRVSLSTIIAVVYV